MTTATPPPPRSRILVVEDDENLRSSLRLNLEHCGYAVEAQETPTSALALLQKESFDIVLCDLRMPSMDGIQFIRECQKVSPTCSIILMSAFGTGDLALEGIRAGAKDYISKPFSVDELVLTMRKTQEREKREGEVSPEAKSKRPQRFQFGSIIAASPAMHSIFETVKRLAAYNTTVLISGESGTGKELIARAIHNNSPRRGKAFVAINCGAIPENLMESELFGHRRGAFTDATRDKRGLFEEADGGTLFLDEVGELPLHLQVKLLRALQEQIIRPVGDEQALKVDVRVIAATLRDLEEDVDHGRFRDDLYYRLNVVSIHLPALRDRPEDIPVLAEAFIKKHAQRLGLAVSSLDPAALDALMKYPWKGNVRELENCIERALVLAESSVIDLAALPDHIQRAGIARSPERSPEISDDNLSIKQRTRALEMQLIVRALEKTSGNRTRAAKILEISHRALLYKLKEYGLTGKDEEGDEAVPE